MIGSPPPPSFHERFNNINWNEFKPIDFKSKLEEDIYEVADKLKLQVVRLINENKALKLKLNRAFSTTTSDNRLERSSD